MIISPSLVAILNFSIVLSDILSLFAGLPFFEVGVFLSRLRGGSLSDGGWRCSFKVLVPA